MPEIRDRSVIRKILSADPNWAVYALGDLAPGYLEHSSWYSTGPDSSALVLLYRAATPAVLFAIGEPREVASLAAEAGEPTVYLHVRQEAANALAAVYQPVDLKPMLRMVLDPAGFRPQPADGLVRLTVTDTAPLERLYADGQAHGESPDFFFPQMLETGVFFGAHEGDELIAAAGTHLAVPQEGVAAVGNVYTRRDRRGRGLASRLTSAVTAELLSVGIRLIALNVSQHNSTAIRVYERLGFQRYCPFIEGLASRLGQ